MGIASRRNTASRSLAQLARSLGVAVALAGVAIVPASAQTLAPIGGRVELKLVGDHLLIPVTLRTEGYENQHHVLIDLGADESFAAYYQTLYSLPYGEGETTLKLLGNELRLEIPRDQLIGVQAGLRPHALTASITAEHDRELGNVDVFGIVGLPALRDFKIEIDPLAGAMTLTPSRADDLVAAHERYDQVVTGVREARGGVYVPVTYGDGQRAFLALLTTGYHTYLNLSDAQSGDVGDITFGDGGDGYSITDMAALFPTDFAELDRENGREDMARFMEVTRDSVAALLASGETPPPNMPRPAPLSAPFDGHVLLRSGLSLLAGYRLEINPSQGYIALSQVTDSNYSEADAAYYAAASAADVDALRRYLIDYPEDRNIREAAGRLFLLALEQGADDETLLEAVRRSVASVEDDRKTGRVMTFVGAVNNDPDLREERSQLLIDMAELGLDFVDRSRSPGARESLQMIIGDRYLALGDAREAWRFFLSAAFNHNPDSDAVVRHELGRAYEAMGRYRRAYSSYQRALTANVDLPDGMDEDARAALARVRAHLDPDDPLLTDAPAPSDDMTTEGADAG